MDLPEVLELAKLGGGEALAQEAKVLHLEWEGKGQEGEGEAEGGRVGAASPLSSNLSPSVPSHALTRIPCPSSWICSSLRPPSLTVTTIDRAPASRLFSTSSCGGREGEPSDGRGLRKRLHRASDRQADRQAAHTLTALAGLATTSPAAMRFTTSASSRKMGGASPACAGALEEEAMAAAAAAAATAGAGVEVVDGPPSGSPITTSESEGRRGERLVRQPARQAGRHPP